MQVREIQTVYWEISGNKLGQPVVIAIDPNDYEVLDKTLIEILSHSQVSIKRHTFKKLEPRGATILYLLDETNFSIYHGPVVNCCANDFDHCGDSWLNNSKFAKEKLFDVLGCENSNTTFLLKRGCVSSLLTKHLLKKNKIRNVKFLSQESSQYKELRVYGSLEMGRILVLISSELNCYRQKTTNMLVLLLIRRSYSCLCLRKIYLC